MPHRFQPQNVVYLIDAKSFQDTDGDGVGDVAGVIARMDYIRGVGADALVLMPQPAENAALETAAAARLITLVNDAHFAATPLLAAGEVTAEAVAARLREIAQEGNGPVALMTPGEARVAERVGPLKSRALALLLMTQPRVPCVWFGDELGLAGPATMPMAWVDRPNAGFTTPEAVPWQPLAADWQTANAAVQSKEPRSVFTLYRRLIALRKLHDTLYAGGVAEIAVEGTLLKMRRTALEDGASTDFVVVVNLGDEVATTTVPKGSVMLTTLLDGEGSEVDGQVTVEAGEGLLIEVE